MEGLRKTVSHLEASADAMKSQLSRQQALTRPLTRPIFTDFYRFFGLPWETSTFKNYHPEDSKHSGSGRIEFSSKSATFLM